MTEIWRKSELRFSLLWIAVYMIGNPLSAELSYALGIKYCVTAAFHLVVSLFLFFWIRENGLMARYGLCKMKLSITKLLWYIPLVILASRNLWNGMAAPLSVADAVFNVCSMIGAGFLEELLFRGFLFRAVSLRGVKRAVVISGVSFGLAHIINWFNGRGVDFSQAVWQVVFATAFGFLCAIIFYREKTLWPCILTHVAFNVAAVFAKGTGIAGSIQVFQNAAALMLVIVYTWALTRTLS